MRRIGPLGGASRQPSPHYDAQLNGGVRARHGGLHVHALLDAALAPQASSLEEGAA